MATLKQRVQQVIDQNKIKSERIAPRDIMRAWQSLSEKEQTWLTLSLAEDELEVLHCIQRANAGTKTINDLLYQVKHFAAKERLAQKLGIENKGELK